MVNKTAKSRPTDSNLYNKTKKYIYKKYPKHSAYRSGLLVQKYKSNFTKKYGNKKQPYIGSKTRKKGLRRWFDEEWVNQRGEVGYKFKNDIYRPKNRITKNTPIIHDELTEKEIKNARANKYRKGRVNRFRKEKINPSYHGGKWSDKYKKNINCKNPKGFSQKQHCKYGTKGGNKTRKNKKSSEPVKPVKREGKYYFKDYHDFIPNLSPREMFLLGSFGGTYWRPIYSGLLKKKLKNVHKKYPEEWWKHIPENELSSKNYDISKNKYKVRVGTSLEFWESKGWIDPSHPYGWVHWYCDFFMGKRSKDDERQISRWQKLAGYKGRFMRFLVTQIINKNATWDDETISPKIRQVLQHWGYKLTKEDYSYEIRRRKKEINK
jgi:hypothetical protein